MSDYILTQSVNSRDERTAGGPAVIARAASGEPVPTPAHALGAPLTNETETAFAETNSSTNAGAQYVLPLKTLDDSLDAGPKSVCGAYAVLADCSSHQHHFAKRIVCGKEWCPDCGEKRSPAHNRRISRILPKAMSLVSMGYFVIEYPDRYREDVKVSYSKKALQNATKAIVDALAGKRCGRRGRVGGFYDKGLLRWHFFGDKAVGKYNPHCNALVPGGYLDADKLEEIKATLRTALDVPDLIVNYSYAETPANMFHNVEYVTRATFKQYSWSPYMAEQLFNFRNMRWWGKWSGESAWSLEDLKQSGEDVGDIAALLKVSDIQRGVCPDCGQPLDTIRIVEKKNAAGDVVSTKAVQWSVPVNSNWLDIWEAEEIAHSGYFRIPHKVWTGAEWSPQNVIRLGQWQAEVKRQRRIAHTAYMRDISDLNYRMRTGQLDKSVFHTIYENVSKEYQRKQAQIWGCQADTSGDRPDDDLDDNYFDSLCGYLDSQGGSPTECG